MFRSVTLCSCFRGCPCAPSRKRGPSSGAAPPQQRSTLTDRTEHVSSDAGSAEDDLKTKPVIDADGGTIEMTEVTTHDHDITRQGGGDLPLRDVISLQANLTDEGDAGSLEMSGDNHIEAKRHLPFRDLLLWKSILKNYHNFLQLVLNQFHYHL